ncbi:MAG: hypothetical protein VB859_10460 [Planctomycetaceae bacterium]
MPLTRKSLDRKLSAIHADPSGCREFILADAKDADMAFGIGAPGRSPERHDSELQFRSLQDYRDQMREIVEAGLVDIMLMSASSSEQLTIQERIFDGSEVTPAVRANDTTDIHVVRGGRIHESASRPFRSASIDHIQCGHLDCDLEERISGADLGLYSITFSNSRDEDLVMLEAYKSFRDEAERKGFRHFLEIFDPNLVDAVASDVLPGFINDLIARTLAGVTSIARPLFLKMVYHGPRATEELANYDPNLIIGILGGSAGTTLDAFQLIHQAQKYGARIALFGRKINNAENQLAFIRFLRLIVDGTLDPTEAVRAYHAVLEKLGITPSRSLQDDLVMETGVMNYAGSQTTISLPAASTDEPSTATVAGWNEEPNGVATGGEPGSTNLGSMTTEERLAYHRRRLDKLLGS